MSELKLIHAADLHLDSGIESLTEESAGQMRRNQQELLLRLTESARSLGADVMLLVGDIFDCDVVSEQTQRDFCRAMEQFQKPVLICAGNHDFYTPGSVWERMSLPENVRLFRNEDFGCLEIPGLDARFWGASFTKTFAPALLKNFAPPEKKSGTLDVMLLHGDLTSAVSDYCPVAREDIEKCGMDYLALGHIHLRTPLQFAGITAYAYPGCPEGRGYDELGEKGCYFVSLSPGNVRAEFVPLCKTRYEIHRIDVTGRDPLAAVREQIVSYSDNYYCRIILLGNTDTEIDLPSLRSEFAYCLKELQLRDETTIARDVWEQTGQDSLAGLFLQKLKDLKDSSDSEEQRRKIDRAAAYGVAALVIGGGRL